MDVSAIVIRPSSGKNLCGVCMRWCQPEYPDRIPSWAALEPGDVSGLCREGWLFVILCTRSNFIHSEKQIYLVGRDSSLSGWRTSEKSEGRRIGAKKGVVGLLGSLPSNVLRQGMDVRGSRTQRTERKRDAYCSRTGRAWSALDASRSTGFSTRCATSTTMPPSARSSSLIDDRSRIYSPCRRRMLQCKKTVSADRTSCKRVRRIRYTTTVAAANRK